MGLDLPVFVHFWVGPSTYSSQERFVRDESIIILRIAAFLDQDIHLLSLQLLSKHHGSVLHFVIQLQTLDEVLKVSGFLRLLHFRVDGEELLDFDELFSLLLCPPESVDHLEGGVEVKAPKAVPKVKHVHSSLALKVINVKGELSTLNILAIQIVRHV